MKDRDHLAHRVAALLEQAAGNAALHKLEPWPDHVEGAAGAIKILLSIAAELADAVSRDAEAGPALEEPAEPLRSPEKSHP